MRTFGLIGYPLSHSFSKKHFSKKFESQEFENCVYENFEIETIEEIHALWRDRPDINGLNVTIPYKEAILPFLDELDHVAEDIGAVNTIAFRGEEKIGYNTDVVGFKESLLPLLKPHMKRALVLGTGGASKAVNYVLKQLNISFQKVSRTRSNDQISYFDIDAKMIKEHSIIINTTPLGMFPNIETCPNLPYEAISTSHLLYDLVYNPQETTFLKQGKQQGAETKNGLQMLELQAEAAWKIWNTYDEGKF